MDLLQESQASHAQGRSLPPSELSKPDMSLRFYNAKRSLTRFDSIFLIQEFSQSGRQRDR